MRDYHPDDYERRENPVHDADFASDLLAWSASLDAERITFERWQDREKGEAMRSY